jgi:single-strand DNA-binding protein
MIQLNRFVGAGHLVRDPELRYTPNGKAVANVALAINERYTVDGDERSTVSFIDVTVFGKPAENLKNLTSKGTEILVEGALKQETWQDKATGQNRSKIVINCSNWQFTQRLPQNVAQVPDSKNQALVSSIDQEGVGR